MQNAKIKQYPNIKNNINPADTPIIMYGTFSLEYIIHPGKISNPSTLILPDTENPELAVIFIAVFVVVFVV